MTMKTVRHLSDGAIFSPWAVCGQKAFPWEIRLTKRQAKVTCKKCKKIVRHLS